MRLLIILLGFALIPVAPLSTSAHVLRDPALRSTLLVSGLQAPTSMAFIGPDDILVLQKQDGRIRRVTGGVLQGDPVLDVAVDNTSERGLLGIAVHPDFPAMPFVYLYLTESNTGADTSGTPEPAGNRVYRFTWTGAVLQDPVLIVALPVLPGPTHNAGVITFGPDGKLYIVIGDLNHNGELQNIAAGPAPDDTGLILRLNDDGTVPADNPFFALGGNVAKYFAYGIRNSFGLTFDPLTGKLWMTENGPDAFDEINLVEPGFNSGWKQILGPLARNAHGVGDLFQLPGSHYADPKFSWLRPVAPTGIAFLDSASLGPEYANNLFVGDFNTGTLYRFRLNAARDGFVFSSPPLADLVADTTDELDEVTFGTRFGGVTDIKVGPDGRLYVLSLPQGVIHVVSRPATPTSLSAGGTGTAPSSRSSGSGGSSTADMVVFRPMMAEASVFRAIASAMPPPIGQVSVAADREGDGEPRTATTPGDMPIAVDQDRALPSDIAMTNLPPAPTWPVPAASAPGSRVPVGTGKPTNGISAGVRLVATDWPAASPNGAPPVNWRAPLRGAHGLGLVVLAAAGLYVLGRRGRPVVRRASAASAPPPSASRG